MPQLFYVPFDIQLLLVPFIYWAKQSIMMAKSYLLSLSFCQRVLISYLIRLFFQDFIRSSFQRQTMQFSNLLSICSFLCRIIQIRLLIALSLACFAIFSFSSGLNLFCCLKRGVVDSCFLPAQLYSWFSEYFVGCSYLTGSMKVCIQFCQSLVSVCAWIGENEIALRVASNCIVKNKKYRLQMFKIELLKLYTNKRLILQISRPNVVNGKAFHMIIFSLLAMTNRIRKKKKKDIVRMIRQLQTKVKTASSRVNKIKNKVGIVVLTISTNDLIVSSNKGLSFHIYTSHHQYELQYNIIILKQLLSMNKFWNAPAWTMGKLYGGNNKKEDDGITPGPGNYNSSLGNRGLSGTKFGNSKRIGLNLNTTPGPGSYNIYGKGMGPKVSIAGKNRLNANTDASFTPGPGNYNPNCNTLYKSQSGITMGFRNNDDRNLMNNPGPGQYNTLSTDGIKVGGKIGTSKRSNFASNDYVPGPGNYNPQSRPYSAGPKYGFTREIKSTFGGNGDPGPGQYQTKGFLDHQGKNGATMGHRNQKADKDQASNTPGPGSYYNDFGGRRSASGVKIGKAQRGSKFGGYGPGPGAYDQVFRAKTGPSAKFGSSRRQGFGRAQTPGPGTYQSNHNRQGGITISGYKGKQNIELTPGPGSYNPDNQGLKSRPCSAKIGKGMRSQQGDASDTPGPGQYYNQRPTNPKFAYTKELRSKDAKGGDPGPGQYDIQASVPSSPYYVLDPNSYHSGSRKI